MAGDGTIARIPQTSRLAIGQPCRSANRFAENLPFIISTDKEKADPETRKLIRSHVMRGKNRVKPKRKRRSVPQMGASEVEALIANGPMWSSSIPRLLCSKLSGIRFADEVEPDLIADAFSCEHVENSFGCRMLMVP